MSASKAIASYVLTLERCTHATSRAEDRPIYQALLADAAGVLASGVAGDRELMQARIATHERLRGQLWLRDPVCEEASGVWEAAKRALGNVAAL